MRKYIAIGTVTLAAALAGCGLETAFSGTTHSDFDRPASALVGALPATVTAKQLTALDAAGAEIPPFMTLLPGRGGNGYEMRLPSSKYSMIRASLKAGNMWLRSIVPVIGIESALTGVDFDSKRMTEALIVEARLSANRGTKGEPTRFSQLDPAVFEGTRAAILADIDNPASPAGKLHNMVARFIPKFVNDAGEPDPGFFLIPELGPDYSTTKSAIDAGWILNNFFDYVGDGKDRGRSTDFDNALADAAKAYDPKGCIDSTHIRAVFTVDFNQGGLDATGNAIDRFKWAKDKPGKQMYFAAWIHADSPVQDDAVTKLLGNATPNVLKMYDDGTNGDEVANDNIWTITFSLPYDDPRNPAYGGDPTRARNLRLGYKYTWGLQGQGWTGSEEWPGNSRIVEIVDVNGDGYFYRRDVFGDEASNKDRSNFNPAAPNGSITWTTDLRHCGGSAPGATPFFHSYEVYELPFVTPPPHTAQCGTTWFTPTAVSPVRVACPR